MRNRRRASIDYDYYRLLEIFESEPRVLDEEVEIYQYAKTDRFGFTLSLHLSRLEDTAIVTLEHRDLPGALFDHIEHGVVKLVCADDDSLHFFRERDLHVANPGLAPEPVLTVLTKHQFRIEIKTD
ncbi:hypothetical protein OS242_00300 [Tumebacillus sp. DT12]|uniref:Uncharacterized protein n=1 Tax=Tumebacillus lacus TaxID=2995335 RepID=A0ABT3WUR3_9BACL|nr:hypothetical protein [Tumebacillus lacus]MCX7568412.1 hypothetical protein [Tumebacillus lacus]